MRETPTGGIPLSATPPKSSNNWSRVLRWSGWRMSSRWLPGYRNPAPAQDSGNHPRRAEDSARAHRRERTAPPAANRCGVSILQLATEQIENVGAVEILSRLH